MRVGTGQVWSRIIDCLEPIVIGVGVKTRAVMYFVVV